MASLIISNNSKLMMLEFAVKKLTIPSTNPFDAVIMSKSIVSFRFLGDEWIDVLPNRLDYRKYRGSCGEKQKFHGGKSVVFAVPRLNLNEKSEGLALDVCVRREISQYFEMECHEIELGHLCINIDDLLNGIIRELKHRRQLKDYLRLAHDRDPISRSFKGTYTLRHPITSELTDRCVDLYFRLSYLGSCVITEIDRRFREPFSYFYAQEETNLDKAYECRELESSIEPSTRKAPPYTTKCLQCVCTDEQRYQMMMYENSVNQETMTECDDGNNKNNKKKKKKKRSDSDSDEEWLNLLRSRKFSGTGGAMVGIVDKKKPCEPSEPCLPCVPCYTTDICITNTADAYCLPIQTYQSPLYCCN